MKGMFILCAVFITHAEHILKITASERAEAAPSLTFICFSCRTPYLLPGSDKFLQLRVYTRQLLKEIVIKSDLHGPQVVRCEKCFCRVTIFSEDNTGGLTGSVLFIRNDCQMLNIKFYADSVCGISVVSHPDENCPGSPDGWLSQYNDDIAGMGESTIAARSSERRPA